MTFVVGLTGGIGSGKTAVSQRFEALGICVVDADLASRAVVAPGRPALEEIAARHGASVLTQDGALDRKRLREIVFADERERLWLEALLHPLIGKELAKQLSEATSRYAVLVSPLLKETGQDGLVDRVLVVDVPESVQVTRTLARDGGSEETIRSIVKAQLSRAQRLAMADDVIENTSDYTHLDAEVKRLDSLYSSLAQSSGPMR
ncbi:MAG: dephospho-CoA kinase [Gammaproteobacteria bacterium]|nr:dephospho-CoA kinase [Gammaproteobacteria bacterium]